MATSSFNRSVVLDNPDSANIIIDALLSDKRRKVNMDLASDENFERGRQALREYSKRHSRN